jgi:hypothetical protein
VSGSANHTQKYDYKSRKTMLSKEKQNSTHSSSSHTNKRLRHTHPYLPRPQLDLHIFVNETIIIGDKYLTTFFMYERKLFARVFYIYRLELIVLFKKTIC